MNTWYFLKNRIWVIAGQLLLLVVVLEVFVFNYRYWESLGNREIAFYETRMGDGLLLQQDGSYLIGEGESCLEFTGIDQPLETLFIDVWVVGQEKEAHPVTIYLAARDTSHENYYWIPDRQIWHTEEKSQYLTYHLYGDCKSLKVTFALDEGVRIGIGWRLNPRIPMFFSLGRVLVVWLLLLFFYLLRPSSVIYRIRFLEMKQGRSIALVTFFILHILLAWLLVRVNPFFQTESVANQQQYQRLAESMGKGQVSILEEPAESLKAMENPYDYALRYQVLGEAGEGFLWDYAYFEEKYYVYFGVVPAALFYLPYYLIMGEHLHNYQAIFLGSIMLLLGCMGVICQVIRRWFPKTSLGIWYLLSELVVLGSGFVYICKRPDLYTVPIVMGLGFGFLGVWAMLCAEKGGKLSAGKMALGSFSIALVAGCRPQLFLVLLLPLMVLKKYWSSVGYLKSEEGRRNGAAVILPMLTVAFLLMYYNDIRFGSVFDFGANYNLTFNDMRNRGFHMDRLPLGIWAYLFAPLKALLVFPFAEANYFSTKYLGVTIMEATYGGIFAVNLFVWMGPLLLVLGRYIQKKTPLRLAYLCMGIGLLILCVDTQMSGILMRYFSDFQLFFLLGAMLGFLLIYESVEGSVIKRCMRAFLAVCLLVTLVYQCRIFFLDTGEALVDFRKDLFSQIKYQVMFWL